MEEITAEKILRELNIDLIDTPLGEKLEKIFALVFLRNCDTEMIAKLTSEYSKFRDLIKNEARKNGILWE